MEFCDAESSSLQSRSSICRSKVLYGGGTIGVSTTSGVVDIYDSTWSTAMLSQARSRQAAAIVGSKLLFAGGSNGVVDIYDDSTGLWSTATLSQARSDLGASVG